MQVRALSQQARRQLLSAKRVRRCTLQLQERLQKLCVSIRDGELEFVSSYRCVQLELHYAFPACRRSHR